jgi:hypothetical protein
MKLAYRLLADAIVTIHFAYVAFVVVGQLLILLGICCRWRWVRNPWFRCLHLAAILIVAGESLLQITCPLSDWEDALRTAAGETVDQGTFLGRWLHYLFRYDLPQDHWIFRTSYISFALLVLVTFLLAPPAWRRRAVPLQEEPSASVGSWSAVASDGAARDSRSALAVPAPPDRAPPTSSPSA